MREQFAADGGPGRFTPPRVNNPVYITPDAYADTDAHPDEASNLHPDLDPDPAADAIRGSDIRTGGVHPGGRK